MAKKSKAADKTKLALQNSKKLVKELTKVNKSVTKERDNLAKKIEAVTAEMETMAAKVTEFSEQNTTLRDQIKNFEKDDPDLQIKLAGKNDTIKTLTAENKKLKAEIAAMKTSAPVGRIKGFQLKVGDPFAAGALRKYLKSDPKHVTQQPCLPFVLPFDDPATEIALKNYILRADGGGDDKELAEAARVVLEKHFPQKPKK